MIEVVGRLPENTRAGTIASAVPSARTSSAVLPNASARVWAKKLARNSSWTSTLAVGERGTRGFGDGDEVGRDQPGALVDQLVERVLAVGAGLAPEHLAGVGGDRAAVPADALAVGLHGQLLEVRREPVQQLGVGQDGVGLGAEEVGVPDVEQPHQGRHVARRARWCGSARPSRGTRPAARRTGRARSPPPARCRSRSPSSSGRRPSPRSRTRWPGRCRTPPPCRARWRRPRSASAYGLAGRRAPAQPVEQPGLAESGVGERLEGAEGLAGDDEQRGSRVQPGQLRGASVGSMLEMNRHSIAVLAVGRERLVGHHRAEVGAADPDVDDRADPLAGDPGPRAGADLVGEGVDPVAAPRARRRRRPDRRPPATTSAGQPQRGVQHGAVLGDVDVVAAEHRVAAVRPARPRRPAPAAPPARRRRPAPLDRSTWRSAAVNVSRSTRPGSSANQRAQVGGEAVGERGQPTPGPRRRRVDGAVAHVGRLSASADARLACWPPRRCRAARPRRRRTSRRPP